MSQRTGVVPSLTLNDLPQATEHLAFEVVYFRLLSDEQFVKTIPNYGIVQAVGYAQLIHFRVLLAFFYPGKTYDDDCTVNDFMRLLDEFDKRFPIAMRTNPAWTKAMKTALNKRLAHFSSARWLDHPTPDWSMYRGPMKELDAVIHAFHIALPDSLRQIFERRIRHWETWSFGSNQRS